MEPNANANREHKEELTSDDLVKILQKNTSNIRNVCILAHVDHGKTSLVDSLISYSNIISPRLAGDVRYMDSRPDEQERCITMKSSSISVPYFSEKFKDNYLINLIDSPGHVDFSSEIYSAMKIVDGALILIDVIEGICCQTENVIREAWDEKIKCVLVFNKLDKLITTVQLDPIEAYEIIKNLLEKVNALISSLIVRDIDSSQNPLIKRTNSHQDQNDNSDNGQVNIDKLIQEKEDDFYFSPEKGNVIFASALDNWAFSLSTFAQFYSEKYGFKREVLEKVLWGDYYMNKKTKTIHTKPININSKPLFVEFILENIYKIYQNVLFDKDPVKINKIITGLKTQITTRELNQNTIEKQPSIILKTIIRQWLPIPSTVYDAIIPNLPNPIQGCKNKLDILFPHTKYANNPLINSIKENVNKGMIKGEEMPTIAFISKMIPLQIKNIQGEDILNENKDDVRFMPFARLFLGECIRGQDFFVIGPKHDSKSNKYDIISFKFDQLYYFMGQFLQRINEVHAGNIFSIGGLESTVFKTATISSLFECPSIIPQNINKSSNIKVSITSENIKEISMLVQGLKKLNRSDPAVEYYMQSNGEHILVTSGEVHLERCLLDLETYLARVKVKTSEPIVNFKEGLGNTNYTFKRLKQKKNEEKEKDKNKNKEDMELTKAKERKMDLDEYYEVVDGEKNIDVTDPEEILLSCTPMVISTGENEKKYSAKIAKHKIKDVISKNEKKVNHFITKNNTAVAVPTVTANATKKKQKGYAEDTTPNKVFSLGISAVGMEKESIDYIIHHQKIIDQIEESNFELEREIYDLALKFKSGLLETIKTQKMKKLIETSLYSFGRKEGFTNLLVIKHISKLYSFFERIKLKDEIIGSNDEKGKEEIDKGQNEEMTNKSTDLTISDNLKCHTTVKEFLNAVGIGFDIAIKNGPLCEEAIHGVVFIIENIQFKNDMLEDDIKDDNNNSSTTLTTTTVINANGNKDNCNQDNNDKSTEESSITANDSNINDIINTKFNKDNIMDEGLKQQKQVEEEKNENKSLSGNNKQDSASLLSSQINTYGPFLGQIMSTVKDCCRKAYLAGEPRLYEAIYLSAFQINQENIGKIHSVINKRRGEIINEIPSDESIKCTIEAVIPVAESFGFVAEIRSKSSGLANPMLQFHEWKILDVDPFDTASQQQIEDFGININTPNIAKSYINKIRQRKGLVTDEKLIKNSDKQKNLAKKR